MTKPSYIPSLKDIEELDYEKLLGLGLFPDKDSWKKAMKIAERNKDSGYSNWLDVWCESNNISIYPEYPVFETKLWEVYRDTKSGKYWKFKKFCSKRNSASVLEETLINRYTDCVLGD